MAETLGKFQRPCNFGEPIRTEELGHSINSILTCLNVSFCTKLTDAERRGNHAGHCSDTREQHNEWHKQDELNV